MDKNDSDVRSWVTIDDDEEDLFTIVGNRDGLKRLKSEIELALDEQASVRKIVDRDFPIRKIILTEKNAYFASNTDTPQSLRGYLASVFLFVWFIFLPFVAVGLLVFVLSGNHSDAEEFPPSPREWMSPLKSSNELGKLK